MGFEFIARLWTDPDADKDEYIWKRAERIAGMGDYKKGHEIMSDLWGKTAAKSVAWDFERQEIFLKSDTHKDKFRMGRTVLEKVPFEKNVYRVPWEMAPQQFGYNICPLKGGDAPHKAYDVDATLGPVILKDINGTDFNNSDEFKALVEMQLATGDDPVVISYKVETDSGGFNISYVIGATGAPVVSGQEILIPVDINRDNWEALVFDLESDLFEGTGLFLIEVDSIELNGKLKIDNIALFKTAE